ncbi:hypothetical protein KC887_03240 [Candidatus Kaiserbacteria bacterium]|nr:hypothetical protein [Candidatus Kaiserbacteria bacterium]
MNTIPFDSFPSDRFMKKHFGLNIPLIGWVDVGFFTSNTRTEQRREIEDEVLLAPKRLLVAEDRQYTGCRTFLVFENYRLTDWVRLGVKCRIDLSGCTPDFENELYHEQAAFVTAHQPFTEEWWEWFAETGNLGVRFTPSAKPGGNKQRRTLKELFPEGGEKYPI